MLKKCYPFKHSFSNMLVKTNISFKLKFSSFSVCMPVKEYSPFPNRALDDTDKIDFLSPYYELT